MDRIVQSYVNDFLTSQEFTEKDTSRQFELFASYCVIMQNYFEQFNIEDVSTGAGGDSGIDGIAIFANGAIISEKEEIDDLIELNKNLSDVNFIFIQAKTSSNFDGSAIGTFGTGVLDFFSENHHFSLNQFLKDKISITEYIISKIARMKSKPNCYLYYVTTGKWVDDKNLSGRINLIKSDLININLFNNVEFTPVDVDLIQKYYRNTIDVVEKTITFPDKVLIPEIALVKQAYLGYLNYKEYLKLITDENGEILKNIFYDNIRDYQGDNNVNNEIAETLTSEDANKFVLFNNGVTIICKRLESLRNNVTIVDYQIVNGCQTSHVLYYNKDNIAHDLQLTVKLIETDNEETVNKIIKATNRQTQITDEQLVALTEFHRKLEAFYNTYKGTQRLYYERRSNQYISADIEKVRIVSVSNQIKAVASMFYDKPHLATRYYGRLLKDIDGIFDNNHKLLPYYTCAYLLYRLEFLFRNKMIDKVYRKFRFYLLMMIKYNLCNGKVSPMNANKIEILCNKILKYANNNTLLKKEVKKMTIIIDRCVPDINDTESTKTKTLVDQILLEVKK